MEDTPKDFNVTAEVPCHVGAEIPVIPYFWDRRSTLKALVSPHRDGQIVVGLLKRFGIGHIDGSSNERAASAAISLLKELQQGTTIAIIPDGPRGPSMTLGLSPLYYAQKTGRPIVGVTYSIANSFVVEKSWDRMLLPKPFNKGICAVTKPFFVPADATKEELETIDKQLAEGSVNPRDIKMKLAYTITVEYHGEEGAKRGQDAFINIVSNKGIPDDIEEVSGMNGKGILDVLVELKFVQSKGEAKRLIQGGGVKINGEKIAGMAYTLNLTEDVVLQAGKRKFVKLKF